MEEQNYKAWAEQHPQVGHGFLPAQLYAVAQGSRVYSAGGSLGDAMDHAALSVYMLVFTILSAVVAILCLPVSFGLFIAAFAGGGGNYIFGSFGVFLFGVGCGFFAYIIGGGFSHHNRSIAQMEVNAGIDPRPLVLPDPAPRPPRPWAAPRTRPPTGGGTY